MAIGLSKRATAPAGSSGITVIVVGLGLAGLTAAVECHRKGHTVVGFDKLPNLEFYGDGIIIAPNGGRVISQWSDDCKQTLEAWPYTCTECDIYNTDGVCIGQHPVPHADREQFFFPRGRLVQTLYTHAQTLGIEMRLGVKVTDYFEEVDCAGILVDGTTRVEADCIIFSDGSFTKARKSVSSRNLQPYQSGFSIFRGKADGGALSRDPRTQWLTNREEGKDRATSFAGENMYLMMATCGLGKVGICAGVIRNPAPLKHSWTTPARKEDMIEVIKDWKCKDQIIPVIEKMTADQFLHCPLVRADPLDSWVSPNGRIALIGDAAHPFFPTSGQGGSQAIEDGAVVAICLQLAGKENLTLGLRAMETLRKHRATYIQRTAYGINDSWFQNAIEDRTGEKAAPALPPTDWITSHCCQTYAYAQFESAYHAVKTGHEFVPNNLPSDAYEEVETVFKAQLKKDPAGGVSL